MLDVDDDNIVQTWLLCILSLIGENYTHGSKLCGTVLSIGSRVNTISIWHADWETSVECSASTEIEIMRHLNCRNPKVIKYQVHKDVNFTKSFNIRLSSSVDTPQAPNSGNEDNDFSSPFLDLINEKIEPPPEDTRDEKSPKRKGHRRSMSVDPPKTEIPKQNSFVRVKLNVKGRHRRNRSIGYHPDNNNLSLPKRHRRRGRRGSSVDKPRRSSIVRLPDVDEEVVSYDDERNRLKIRKILLVFSIFFVVLSSVYYVYKI
eukprot:TRINITY_DN2113_c0_g1_i1.p1 TRINITY_DN2113_c0_g1~~TRINITY_DN2113_c0_g1_i1.p1  ORF type:complete len:260 (-),score=36.74 TRINITY_DN2113_c0_g1_i1:21-800(-)